MFLDTLSDFFRFLYNSTHRMQPTNTYYGGGVGSSNYQAPKRANRRLLLIGVMALLVVITAILGVVSVSRGSSQQKLSDEFVKKFIASDIEGTYALLAPETKNKETAESWSTKIRLTEGFFTVYKSAKLIIDDPSAEQSADETNPTETHTYIAKGRDGTYALTVTVSKDKSNYGVVSFDSSPYIDIEKVLE